MKCLHSADCKMIFCLRAEEIPWKPHLSCESVKPTQTHTTMYCKTWAKVTKVGSHNHEPEIIVMHVAARGAGFRLGVNFKNKFLLNLKNVLFDSSAFRF